MLHNLHLIGFKKHTDLQVPLKPGLNYIVGPNYSGKSSILHSILFALGGVASVPGGAEVAYGWGSKRTQVTVGWDKYQVTRTRTSGGTEMWQDGLSVASGITAVNNRLTDTFGMSSRDLMKVIYAEQGSTAALVSELGEGEVNRLIETLSGVQEVDTYVKTISSMRSEVKGALSSYYLPDGAPSLSELKAAAEVNAGNLRIRAMELKQAEAARVMAEKELEKWDAEYTAAVKVEELKERIASLTNRIEELTEQRDSVPLEAKIEESQVQEAKNRAISADKERAFIQEKLRESTNYTATLKAAQEQVDFLIKSCATEQELEELEKEITKIKKIIGSYDGSISEADQEWAAQKNKLEAKRALLKESVCPTCLRPYDGPEVNPETLELEIVSLKEKQAQLHRKRATLVSEKNAEDDRLQVVSKKLILARANQKDLADATAKLEALQDVPRETVTDKDFQAAIDTANRVKNEYHDLVSLREAYLRSAEHHRKMAEYLSATETSLSVHQTELAALGKTLDSEIILAKRQEAAKAHRKTFSEVNSLSIQVSELKSQGNSLSGAIETEESRLKQVAKLMGREEQLNRLRKFLLDNRARFLEGVWSKVLAYASQVMQVTTGGALQELSRVEGAFRYKEEGSDKFRPLAAASGSQKSIIGIGLKLAMAKSLPCGIDFLLLDEATSDMDAIHSAALMKYLGGCGLQVISVTHNPEDLAVDANVVQLN